MSSPITRFEDYAAGRLKGWSINVLPVHQSPPTREEMRARPDWEGLEIGSGRPGCSRWTATSLPGNPSTLTLSVERRFGGASPVVMTRAKLEEYTASYRQIRREHRCATVGWMIGRDGAVLRADFSKLSIEELEHEIKRIELMEKLCELLGKAKEREEHQAEALKMEKAKQEFASQAVAARK